MGNQWSEPSKDPWGNPRNPRPKGSQKDTVCRTAGGGCLMSLLLLPALPVLALVRRRASERG